MMSVLPCPVRTSSSRHLAAPLRPQVLALEEQQEREQLHGPHAVALLELHGPARDGQEVVQRPAGLLELGDPGLEARPVRPRERGLAVLDAPQPRAEVRREVRRKRRAALLPHLSD